MATENRGVRLGAEESFFPCFFSKADTRHRNRAPGRSAQQAGRAPARPQQSAGAERSTKVPTRRARNCRGPRGETRGLGFGV